MAAGLSNTMALLRTLGVPFSYRPIPAPKLLPVGRCPWARGAGRRDRRPTQPAEPATPRGADHCVLLAVSSLLFSPPDPPPLPSHLDPEASSSFFFLTLNRLVILPTLCQHLRLFICLHYNTVNPLKTRLCLAHSQLPSTQGVSAAQETFSVHVSKEVEGVTRDVS